MLLIKKPGKAGFFAFSYEVGDSEFFNYLVITIPGKCEDYVFKLFKKNKIHINRKV